MECSIDRTGESFGPRTIPLSIMESAVICCSYTRGKALAPVLAVGFLKLSGLRISNSHAATAYAGPITISTCGKNVNFCRLTIRLRNSGSRDFCKHAGSGSIDPSFSLGCMSADPGSQCGRRPFPYLSACKSKGVCIDDFHEDHQPRNSGRHRLRR